MLKQFYIDCTVAVQGGVIAATREPSNAPLPLLPDKCTESAINIFRKNTICNTEVTAETYDLYWCITVYVQLRTLFNQNLTCNQNLLCSCERYLLLIWHFKHSSVLSWSGALPGSLFAAITLPYSGIYIYRVNSVCLSYVGFRSVFSQIWNDRNQNIRQVTFTFITLIGWIPKY